MSQPDRDCNSCARHMPLQHPSTVEFFASAAPTIKVSCAKCLNFADVGKTLPWWQSKDQKSGAATKQDAGKVGLHLLPTGPLEEIAKVLDFGAKKYAPNQWRKGLKWTRLGSALLRHTFAWMRGQDNDPETGLSHLAHAGCCILFLLQYVLDAARGNATYAENDDRYKEAA